MHHFAQPSYLLYGSDCNFLKQAVGNKRLWVYDHTDPSLVSQEAREVRSIGW
jgi:hypothetical protein